ncbi:UbiA family prenyltransferase [Streptomyces bacillaris]|uniref:Prenyltransferase n=2 Tax=Streptomyces TaxID=1883 RepID=A0AAD0Q839_9ACTN|nr:MULTISPECIES: UbiA family prenyltransferase [Streptomyces]NUW21657.1 UbiA family prenyltransferase [Streptomyces roseoviolaceus]AXI74098.1 prenyltransferase [Streptomyces cavourensis]NUV87226.1 UbiA family prenyltransferase [Streptomyces sp. KAI-26]TQO33027.1 1,4-dihydroxy-2-naphthoate octaprenyltransferase [Streptomyces cavourensis]UTR78442.1 UbiA family prenyltransferase [Streptomyces cavourensis]
MAATPQVSPAPTVFRRFGVYARLVKFQFVIDFLLALAIVWTAMAPETRLSGPVLLTVALFAVGKVGVLSAVMTLDDVTGIRDGSDSANYLGEGGTELRPLKRKPLLTGDLTVEQAERFGLLGLAWGAVWWLVAIVRAPHTPLWAVVVTVLLLSLSVQYSWGLKLSYLGLGEALLLFSASAFVLSPYGITTGHLPALVLVEALLFGFGQLMIAGYSNTKDISGDAAVGRRTVAVLTSERGNRLFLGGLTAVNLLVVVGPAVAGWITWWFVVALLPLIVLRLHQYAGFLRTGHALLARSRGVVAFRVTVACILVFNVVHFGF